jgi:hypothetical protein
MGASVPLVLQYLARSVRGVGADAGKVDQPPPVLLARTSADVVKAWRSHGMRARTIVHAGRFLHFVESHGAKTVRLALTERGSGAKADALLQAEASPANYLWVAASTNVARRIFYLSPPKALAARLDSLRLTPAALPLQIDAAAIPRTLAASPPHLLEEPVLLDVNASWFDEADGATLLASVRGSGLRMELVTVGLAEDAADVTPAARAAARAFAASLSAESKEPTP